MITKVIKIKRLLKLDNEKEVNMMSQLIPINHNGQMVLTSNQLANSYETDNRRISENFNSNKSRYTEGKHYFLLEGDELKKFGDQYANSVSVTRVSKLYLWTEKGAWLHAKSLNTDRAWEAYEMLVDEYYRITQEKALQQFNIPQNYPDALLLAANLEKERLQLQHKIEQDKPLVLFAESVQVSETSILIRDMAKLLKQNGVDIGGQRFFDYLRDNGYLVKGGSDKNMPTQRSMDLKIIEVKTGTRTGSEGVVHITRTPKVTGKGQVYFINKFLNKLPQVQ